MSLHKRAAFQAFVLGLPAVTVAEQWGLMVAKVGGKVFALNADTGGDVVFKVSETSFLGLTSLRGISQAPYFAKGQWVIVAKGSELSTADLKAYVRESHRVIAAKLTRKARAELGLQV